MLNKYTIQHLQVFKGANKLPAILVVPNGGCGLILARKGTYLLSGMIAEQVQLMFTSCLSLNGASPVWNKVSRNEKKELKSLKCPIASTLPTSVPTIPTGLPTIPLTTITRGVVTQSGVPIGQITTTTTPSYET